MRTPFVPPGCRLKEHSCLFKVLDSYTEDQVYYFGMIEELISHEKIPLDDGITYNSQDKMFLYKGKTYPFVPGINGSELVCSDEFVAAISIFALQYEGEVESLYYSRDVGAWVPIMPQ